MASKAVGVPASSFASHSLNSCSSEANALGFGENLLVGGPHRGKPHSAGALFALPRRCVASGTFFSCLGFTLGIRAVPSSSFGM